jgi:lysophospholipase L1-like esterase
MIYCIGDSFTYGDELPDPRQSAWPAVLGNLLNKSVVNMGRKGSSNTRIVKRIIDCAFKDDTELMVIAWSGPDRLEFYNQGILDNTWPGKTLRDPNSSDYIKAYTRLLTIYYDAHYEQWAYKKWLREIILTQALLKQQNKKYLMVVSWHSWGPKVDCEDLWKQIDFSHFMGIRGPYGGTDPYYETFCEWVFGTPHGPGNHPLEPGHRIIAEKINEHIRNLGWLS